MSAWVTWHMDMAVRRVSRRKRSYLGYESTLCSQPLPRLIQQHTLDTTRQIFQKRRRIRKTWTFTVCCERLHLSNVPRFAQGLTASALAKAWDYITRVCSRQIVGTLPIRLGIITIAWKLIKGCWFRETTEETPEAEFFVLGLLWLSDRPIGNQFEDNLNRDISRWIYSNP